MLCLMCGSRDTQDDERDNPCVMSTEAGKISGLVDLDGYLLETFRLISKPENIQRTLFEVSKERVYNACSFTPFSVFLTLNTCSHCSPQESSVSRTFSLLSYDLS
jgi:hypothetical protein